MAQIHLSSKKVQIDKSQATIVVIAAAAIFVTVFSLVSAKALWTQRSYQEKVITKKEKARDQLETNNNAVKDLVLAYKSFAVSSPNIIDGNPTGTGERDGDNARIVLDALPSKYDFPALTTSIEKMLIDRKFLITSISGTDDEVAQSTVSSNGDPLPTEIPFQFDVTGSAVTVQDLLESLERSIRPIQVKKITLQGSSSKLNLKIDAKTYYQPEKALNIKEEVVK